MISSTAAPVKNVLGEPPTRARQFCRPQINGLAGRPSYGLLKEVRGTGNLSVETTENGCPAVRSAPIRHAAERYAVTGRDVQIAGPSRFANPITT